MKERTKHSAKLLNASDERSIYITGNAPNFVNACTSAKVMIKLAM